MSKKSFQNVKQSCHRQSVSGTEVISFWSTMPAYNAVFNDCKYYGDLAVFLKLDFDFQTRIAEFAYCQEKLIRNFSMQKLINGPQFGHSI